MSEAPRGEIQIGSDADHSVLVTGSENVVIQAENVMLHAVQQASLSKRDPARKETCPHKAPYSWGAAGNWWR